MFNCRLRLAHLWLGNVNGIRRQKVLPLPRFTDHMIATYKSSMSGNKSSKLVKWASSTMSVVFTAMWIPINGHCTFTCIEMTCSQFLYFLSVSPVFLLVKSQNFSKILKAKSGPHRTKFSITRQENYSEV